jgi:hypothetical protein
VVKWLNGEANRRSASADGGSKSTKNGIDPDPDFDSDLDPDETYSNRRSAWVYRYQSGGSTSTKALARQVAGRLSAPNWERRFQPPTVNLGNVFLLRQTAFWADSVL